MSKHTYEINSVAGEDETTIELDLDDHEASLLRIIEQIARITELLRETIYRR